MTPAYFPEKLLGCSGWNSKMEASVPQYYVVLGQTQGKPCNVESHFQEASGLTSFAFSSPHSLHGYSLPEEEKKKRAWQVERERSKLAFNASPCNQMAQVNIAPH